MERFGLDDLIFIFCGIVLGRDDETSAFTRAVEDGLHNVDEFLLVVHWPVDFIVVTGPQIDLDVLIAIEEHDGDGIV